MHVNQRFLLHPKTVLAMKAFGRALAQDLRDADPEGKPEQRPMAEIAGDVLQLLDQLDEGADEANDRDLTAMAVEGGETWLDLAERGLVARGYVEHVVAHVETGGVEPLPVWVRYLLHTIDASGDEERDDMALAFPEYVGLLRAARTPGNLPRMRALVKEA